MSTEFKIIWAKFIEILKDFCDFWRFFPGFYKQKEALKKSLNKIRQTSILISKNSSFRDRFCDPGISAYNRIFANNSFAAKDCGICINDNIILGI